jgi:hypothetical protein
LSSGLDGGDTGKGKGDEGDEEADDPDEDMDKPDEDGSGAKEAPEISRPAQGEVKWWSNLVEVGGLRDKRYGWGGVDGTSPTKKRSEVADIQLPIGICETRRSRRDKQSGLPLVSRI